ncbi:MAG: GMC family oxidoreductase [Deltaproteobacteria bacterium]|jgi:choline dehydrogenase-like flavoprotein|nr:GMC family oxidoreductase [Deltaproteobacteria bacterium]
MIIEPHTIEKDLEVSADVCIIGSGSGGAVAAAKLAEAGLSVICLEAGGHYNAQDFDSTERSMTKLYAEKGLRASNDLSLVILTGSNLGGGTTINWMLCFRTPDYVLEEWEQDFKLEGFTSAEMKPLFEEVEGVINASYTAHHHHNWNNHSLLAGGKKLGFNAYNVPRNADGCQRTGACSYGCPFNAKQGALLTYIPRAMKAGAKFYTNCRVGKIVHKQGVYANVEGVIHDRETGAPRANIKVKSKVLVTAAGALDTAALLLRSDVPNPSGVLGESFFCHPVVALASHYEKAANPFYGIPQSTTVDFFQINDIGSGYKLEGAPVFPALGATAAPGFGRFHKDFMRNLNHYATQIVLVRDRTPHASIGVKPNGMPSVDYALSDNEIFSFRHGMKNLARINFEMGANHIYTIATTPTRLDSLKDLDKLDGMSFSPNDYTLLTAHQMATCPMGEDKSKTVIDSNGEYRGVKNLFVMDGSVFPNAPGVNPMVSIMGFSTRLANKLISNRAKYFS